MAVDKDTAAILELLIDKIGQIQTGGGGLTTEQLERLLEKSAGIQADAFKMALIPENKVNAGISAFAPDGEVNKPKLSRRTVFCGHEQRDEQLTPEEVVAFNAIDTDCEAREGRWWAKIVRDGLKPILVVHCEEAADRDVARDLPPLTVLLMELKRGPKAVDLLALHRQLETMQAQLVAAGIQPHAA